MSDPDDTHFKQLTREWFLESAKQRYSYRFTWMGVPIIQYPQDIVAMQEIIWRIQPDLIVETGIAHGGSLVFYASMLELLGGDRRVLGIDIDIRAHNRAAIDAHPMRKRIDMIEGSSIAPETVRQVNAAAAGRKCIMVVLDSNHTHDHVLAELRAYSDLVTNNSYLIVFDTVVEDMPDQCFPDRPWRRTNSPKSAVHEFMNETKRFELDHEIEQRLMITVSPDGFLRCTGPADGA